MRSGLANRLTLTDTRDTAEMSETQYVPPLKKHYEEVVRAKLQEEFREWFTGRLTKRAFGEAGRRFWPTSAGFRQNILHGRQNILYG